jgi:Asp-tRNA(Asn)/Glu-tRNA(Gln) amidotransferase A subunit family amidase
MNDTLDLPATLAGLNAALRCGDFTPAEALAEQRRRCARNDRAWHALIDIAPPREADGVSCNAATLGPLAGAALAHKDVFDIAGRTPTCGMTSGNYAGARGGNDADPASDRVPQQDAAVLAALARAGAHYAGSLCLAQLAGGSTAENPALPRPINPLDARATVGGSSSGSAVAVAGDLCYASLGTDTAGSVRIPAATCGLIGLKTTSGAVSTAGVMPLAPSLDTVGVIARNALDTALVFLCMSAARQAALPDPLELQQRLATASPRLAVTIDDTQIDSAVGAALSDFADRVATCTEARVAMLPHNAPFPEWSRRAQLMLHAEAARIHLPRLRMRADDPLPAPLAGVLTPGVALPEPWYHAALDERPRALDDAISLLFGHADMLLTPALPCPIPDWDIVYTGMPRFAARTLFALHRHTAWVNYLGLPAVVFPIGRDAAGRPLSAQLVGRPYAELALVALVHQCERDGLADTAARMRTASSQPLPDTLDGSGFRTRHA